MLIPIPARMPAPPAIAVTTATSLKDPKVNTIGATSERRGARNRLISAKYSNMERKYLLRIENRKPPRISSHKDSGTSGMAVGKRTRATVAIANT